MSTDLGIYSLKGRWLISLMMIMALSINTTGCLNLTEREVNNRIDPSAVDPSAVDQSAVDQSAADASLDRGFIPEPCDEPTPSRSCREVSAALGVCAEEVTECRDGRWTSCAFDDLKIQGRYREYLSEEETCDCFDNDCDGIVDENINCIPTLQMWTMSGGFEPQRHCHYRPYGSARGDRINSVELFPEGDMIYELASLTVEQGMTVYIRKRDVQSSQPGYLPDHERLQDVAYDEIAPCLTSAIGGRLRVRAGQIIIEDRGTLSASSSDLNCQGSESFNGPSGGDLLLAASEITINGEVNAHGSEPRPRLVQVGDEYVRNFGMSKFNSRHPTLKPVL